MAFDFGAASVAWEAFKAVQSMRGGEKLEQQTADSILPTLKDETILLAVDQAVSQLTIDATNNGNDSNTKDNGQADKISSKMKVDGKLVMKKITALRSKRLKSHQNNRWRKIIATLILTEHFEQFETSTITKTPIGTEKPQEGVAVKVPFDPKSRRPGQQGNQNKKTGLDEIIRSYQRMPKDYEYTWEDPRVAHLVMVAGLIENDDPQYDPDNDVDDFAQAYQYLLANYFDEKSIPEMAIEKAKKLQEAIASGTYDAFISFGLSDDLESAEKLVAEDDSDRIAKLNAAYREALDFAIMRKRNEIESHRDGIEIWDRWKNTKGEDMVRIKTKWISTYFSLGTWFVIIATAAIFWVAWQNS
jgi:hypothetical protein